MVIKKLENFLIDYPKMVKKGFFAKNFIHKVYRKGFNWKRIFRGLTFKGIKLFLN